MLKENFNVDFTSLAAKDASSWE